MFVLSNILEDNSRNLLREEQPCDDEIKSPIDDDDDDEFPAMRFRVLLVDADPNSLLLMKNLMTNFSYQVTTYENGKDAIAFLNKSRQETDLVIWDFHMPEINGLEALKTIAKEMDLPVVIMSHDHKKKTVMQSTKHGACDFLVKPVSKEVVAVLWRHVFRKMMRSKSGSDSIESDPEEDGNIDNYMSNEEGSKNAGDSGEQNTCSYRKGDKSSSKKPRMQWTPELHQKFELAVKKIGSNEKAFPKQILKCMQEEMNVVGLTRNNVASHLQKYRQNVDKKNRVPQETQEAYHRWNNVGANAALTASRTILNTSNNPFLNHTRLPYFTSEQAPASPPIQYPSSSYMTMNNNFVANQLSNNNVPYDQFYQAQRPQQQQQEYYSSSLPLPPVIARQDSGFLSGMDLIYGATLPDEPEHFPQQYNNNFSRY